MGLFNSQKNRRTGPDIFAQDDAAGLAPDDPARRDAVQTMAEESPTAPTLFSKKLDDRRARFQALKNMFS